jgi:hypothetical protein
VRRLAIHKIGCRNMRAYAMNAMSRPSTLLKIVVPESHGSVTRMGIAGPNDSALVSDGCSCPIKPRDVDGERLVVALGAVLQHAQRNLLTQQKRIQA